MAVMLLLFLLLAIPAHAGQRWHGPNCDTLGVKLEACSYVEGPAELPAWRWPDAYRLVDQHPELLWLSFAVLNDQPARWPNGLQPVLYAPGRQLPTFAFLVGGPPQLHPMLLPALLLPDALWRKRLPCVNGKLAGVLFVGYPRGAWSPDSAVAVRLEPR